MNAQVKLLMYIGMICLIFYFVQDRFDIFDIQFISDMQDEKVVEKDETSEDFLIERGELKILRGDGMEVKVDVDIVDTEEERTQGLMYRESLGAFSGMLFIFDEEADNSFWMKNTKISLDLIFFNQEKVIIDIIENAQPCTEGHICPSLRPQFEYMYCLEVNAGFVEENRIDVGDSIEWVVE